MKRFIFITAILALLCSCTDREICRKLEDVESYIMERPDSALKVLESIDRAELTSERSRAHHALLHAMALDKNGIDVTSDSLAMIAVEYYKDNEPQRNYARALYYLGKCYYYRGEYDKAILEYSKAEKVAVESDRLYLGMIKCGQADTYNRTYNSIEELNCIQQALDIFKEIGVEHYIRPVMLSLGRAYHNCDKYEEAVEIYSNIIELSPVIDYYHIQATIEMAQTMVECDEVNYQVVDSLFRKALYYDGDFEEINYWAWVYSLYKIGKIEEAEGIIADIEITDELTANFWKARISAYLKDYETVYKCNLLCNKYQNDAIEGILKESLAAYQRDYFESQFDLSKAEAENSRLMFYVVLLSSSVFLVLAAAGIIWYVRRQKRAKEQYILYISEIRCQLEEAKKDDYPALKRKYLTLYKSKFETIGTLCEQYVHSQDLVNAEKSIYKKVVSLVDDFTNDYTNRAKFESMLDDDLDNIMSNLRSEMPSLKEKDYVIFSFLVIGFDVTTISNLMNITANTVYIRKCRIKHQIEEHNPPHKNHFLEVMG